MHPVYMEIVFDNTVWMSFNIALAVFAIVNGWLTIKVKLTIIKLICAALWILFLPNTIYILTDIVHLKKGLSLTDGMATIVLALQYLIFILIGIMSFIFAVYPLELLLKSRYIKDIKAYSIIIVAIFIVAFGAILGRVQRTNSWDVFVNTTKVLNDVINTVISPESMILVFLLGLIGNLLYFLLKKHVITSANLKILETP